MNPQDGNCQAQAQNREPWTFPAMSIEYGAERIAAVEPRIVAHIISSSRAVEREEATLPSARSREAAALCINFLLIYIISLRLMRLSIVNCLLLSDDNNFW